MPQQFENPANPAIHRATTAEEIWRDTDGKIDIFVAGVGTGGTITGVGQVLKERKPSVQSRRRAGRFTGAVGRREGTAPDPGHRRRIRAGGPRHGTDRRDHHRGNERRVRHRAAAGHAKRACSSASPRARRLGGVEVARGPENAGKLIVVVLPSFGERYLSTALFADLATSHARRPRRRPGGQGTGPRRPQHAQVVLCYPGLHAIWGHRVSHWLWHRRPALARPARAESPAY